MRYAINSNKLKKQLKWKPKVSFMNGLEKTFNWYINNQKYYSNLNKQDILKRLGKKMIKKGIILSGGMGTRIESVN